MQQLIEFATHHWALVGVFIVLLIFVFWEEARSKGLGARLTCSQATRLINSEDAVVFDIRSINDFKKGHIVNAINLPEANSNMEKLNKYKKKPIILVCNNGQKSGGLAMKLKKQGFAQLQVLSGGISEWTRAGLPLTKEKGK